MESMQLEHCANTNKVHLRVLSRVIYKWSLTEAGPKAIIFLTLPQLLLGPTSTTAVTTFYEYEYQCSGEQRQYCS